MKKTSAFVHWETGRVFEEPVSTKIARQRVIATPQASFVMKGFFFFSKKKKEHKKKDESD